ncbi:MAG TPA: isochorismate synthase [Candidatus Limnocylindrales bacterium]|nr:isochorismate synthase [Candidatus Limnocylindrales bacterium]
MTATRDARAGLGAGLGERLAAIVPMAAVPGDVLASATMLARSLDPISVYAAAVEAGLEASLWLRPSEGSAFVGVGRAWAVEAAGAARFGEAERAWSGLIARARVDGPPGATGPAGPVLLGGMGFTGRAPAADDPWAPFGGSSLVLPELLLTVTPAGAFVTASIVDGGEGDARRLEGLWSWLGARARDLAPSPNGIIAMPVFAPLRIVDEQPTHDAWRRLVGMYAGAVGRGRIDKVVLARRVGMRSRVELDVPNALRRLAASAPESTTYAFRRGGRTFLGATPEGLVATRGRTFRTVAVAGTIRRGVDAAEDADLARRLLASEKDREEHAIVVDAIRDLLAPVADSLIVAPEARVMTLRFLQHLVTDITGTLPEGRGLLALGERLHPTPAVGGDPREVALALIDEHEGFDRGWYAGPIGWLGADGDGELCVALRCGIVDRTQATLFAGCGIVADSDPDQEWEESRIKLRAVIAALGIPEDDA